MRALCGILSVLLLLALSACGLSPGKVSVKVELLPDVGAASAAQTPPAPRAASPSPSAPQITAAQPAPVSGAETGQTAGEPGKTPSESETRDYVLNTGSKKFHLPDCKSVSDISEKNRAAFHGTRDALLAEGYTPCKRCNP